LTGEVLIERVRLSYSGCFDRGEGFFGYQLFRTVVWLLHGNFKNLTVLEPVTTPIIKMKCRTFDDVGETNTLTTQLRGIARTFLPLVNAKTN